MTLSFSSTNKRRLAAVAVITLLAGCAAQQAHNDGLAALQAGRVGPALDNLRKASELEPGNARYRIDYLTQRELATQAILLRADDARNAGRLDEALARYREALQLDDANERALRGLALVDEQRKADAAIAQSEKYVKANQFDAARDVLARAAKDLPTNHSVSNQLRALDERVAADRAARERLLASTSAFRKPVTLQFRDANLKMVFEALSRAANVNVILDRDVKSDLKTTIYVKDASVEDTIDLILLQNQLEKRVLNSNTLFVYPSTAAKQKEYSELKVRSFQVSNVDAAVIANLIKTLLKTKDVVTDPRSNTVVMRDTPEAIAVAEKLVAANDVPDPEVMLEVQVLEVSADRLANLGIKWPDSVGISTPPGATTIGDMRALRRDDLLVTPLGIGLNLMLQDTDTNILASPRIRTRNKEKAKILIGDKVPVITNLLTPQQAGQTSVITGSIQYVDVGIKLEVEPQVYVDGDVGIKMNLEVSNISKTITTDSGIAYQIGTRSAQTALRLKDGETQVLAGLMNEQDRNTANKVPGLGQIPGVGKLFSSNNGTNTRSEIVLSITPHIIRPQTLPEARVGDVWSGTESLIRDKPLRLDPLSAAGGGAVGALPALGDGTAERAAGNPVSGPKAGGAGGSTILGPNRLPLDLPAGNPQAAGAAGAAAVAGAAGGAEAPGAAPGAAPGTGTVPAGAGGAGTDVSAPGTATQPTAPARPMPRVIRPGRAMTPTPPSAPSGTPATAPTAGE